METPLFINTIGAWPNRPEARSKKIENLFFAGDWVRNPVDLACMEGAVSSALQTAKEICAREGLSAPGPLEAKRHAAWKPRALKWLLAPAIFPVWAYTKVLGSRPR